jgi:RND family efflux transporter MFP subunit
VEVRAQVPGVLTSLRVDRGSAVRQGQQIARIEAEGIRGQAAGAQAAVAAAQAQVALARRQHESAKKLHAAGAMSDIELQQAAAAQQAAEAQLAAAQAQASAAVESAGRSIVVAPITGEVSQRHASEGEALNPGQAIVTIVDSRTLELAGQVPVNQAVLIRPGQPVEFTLDAFPGRVLRGAVARVEPTADIDTRNIGVYVRVPNADRSLVGGLFATGRIQTGGTSETVVVPAAAVRSDAMGTFVWAIVQGRAVLRRVSVGTRDTARGTVQILDGLVGGEQVIVSPGEVREGMAVRVGAAAPTTGSQ